MNRRFFLKNTLAASIASLLPAVKHVGVAQAAPTPKKQLQTIKQVQYGSCDETIPEEMWAQAGKRIALIREMIAYKTFD